MINKIMKKKDEKNLSTHFRLDERMNSRKECIICFKITVAEKFSVRMALDHRKTDPEYNLLKFFARAALS